MVFTQNTFSDHAARGLIHHELAAAFTAQLDHYRRKGVVPFTEVINCCSRMPSLQSTILKFLTHGNSILVHNQWESCKVEMRLTARLPPPAQEWMLRLPLKPIGLLSLRWFVHLVTMDLRSVFGGMFMYAKVPTYLDIRNIVLL